MKLLKPLVVFCLRHSLRLQDLIDVAKLAFVQSAKEQLSRESEKISASRLCIMTGVHRHDAMKLLTSNKLHTTAIDLVTKVIGHWQTDAKYQCKDGSPQVLSTENDPSEFDELVYSISSDLSPKTVLFELERIGAVETSPQGVRLRDGARLLKGDPEGGFLLAASDVSDLIQAVSRNLLDGASAADFHARTEYDRVRADGVDRLRRWFLREGHRFHERARKAISRYDLDINPKPEYRGPIVRVALSGFSFIEPKEPEKE